MSLLPLLLAMQLAAATPAERVDLRGVVRDDAGAPIKDATVLIFTAQPRKGVGTICPSCYVDCWRRASTDDQGRFTIEKVDASLLFRVGAVTPSHETAFKPKVDPLLGDAEIALRPRRPLPDAPQRMVRARIVDLHGKPVSHAVISPEGFRNARGGGSFGSVPGIPSLTISDEQGAFAVAAGRDIDGTLIFKITARGLATTLVDVAPGAEERKLAVGPGCAVRGRVLKDGKPVAGLTFGIVQTERASGSFLGEMTTSATNAEGRFVLANVTTNDLVMLYSKMADIGRSGSVAVKYVETMDHGAIIDVGDLTASPARRLTGRVVLPAAQPLPADCTVTVFRQTAWDMVTVPIADDGSFAADVVANEPLSVSVGVKGYRLADKHGRAGRHSLPLAPLEKDRALSLPLDPEPPTAR